MRMPVIGAAIGGLALGAIVVAGSRYVTSPVQASLPAPSLGSTQLVSQGAGPASNTVLVDCADGQRALVRHADVAGQSVAQVQCVGQALTTTNAFDEMSTATTARAYPVSMSRPASYSAPAPAPTRTVASRQPVSYRTASTEPVRKGRTWKKSALIIGGSAAGGAGIGAIVGGKGGAIKGAVLGGVAGTVYDIATRNK